MELKAVFPGQEKYFEDKEFDVLKYVAGTRGGCRTELTML